GVGTGVQPHHRRRVGDSGPPALARALGGAVARSQHERWDRGHLLTGLRVASPLSSVPPRGSLCPPSSESTSRACSEWLCSSLLAVTTSRLRSLARRSSPS